MRWNWRNDSERIVEESAVSYRRIWRRRRPHLWGGPSRCPGHPSASGGRACERARGAVAEFPPRYPWRLSTRWLTHWVLNEFAGFSFFLAFSILSDCVCLCALLAWGRRHSEKQRAQSFHFWEGFTPILHVALLNISNATCSLLFFRARLVHVFKNWKLLFENFCGNTCGWKSVLKYVKYCLKTENCCLKTLTKHPLNLFTCLFFFLISFYQQQILVF